MTEHLSRRGLLGAMLPLIAAPAIVRASSLMAVRSWKQPPVWLTMEGWDQYGSAISETVEMKPVTVFGGKRQFASVTHFYAEFKKPVVLAADREVNFEYEMRFPNAKT